MHYFMCLAYKSQDWFCVRPCVGLGSLGMALSGMGKSQLKMTSGSPKGLPDVIFSLECYEHKEGSVRPSNGFSGLQLSLYSMLISTPTHFPYYYHMQYHYPHKKSCWNLFA